MGLLTIITNTNSDFLEISQATCSGDISLSLPKIPRVPSKNLASGKCYIGNLGENRSTTSCTQMFVESFGNWQWISPVFLRIGQNLPKFRLKNIFPSFFSFQLFFFLPGAFVLLPKLYMQPCFQSIFESLVVTSNSRLDLSAQKLKSN